MDAHLSRFDEFNVHLHLKSCDFLFEEGPNRRQCIEAGIQNENSPLPLPSGTT